MRIFDIAYSCVVPNPFAKGSSFPFQHFIVTGPVNSHKFALYLNSLSNSFMVSLHLHFRSQISIFFIYELGQNITHKPYGLLLEFMYCNAVLSSLQT